MIDYKYKYLKYKKKYEKIGGHGEDDHSHDDHSHDDSDEDYDVDYDEDYDDKDIKKYEKNIKICGCCTFSQFKLGNRLITLIGEDKKMEDIPKKDEYISVGDYVLGVLKSNSKAKVLIEDNVFNEFMPKIENMKNRIRNIDYRCSFLKKDTINKIYNYYNNNKSIKPIKTNDLMIEEISNRLKSFVVEKNNKCNNYLKITNDDLLPFSGNLLDELETHIIDLYGLSTGELEIYDSLLKGQVLDDNYYGSLMFNYREFLINILKYFCCRELFLDNEYDEIVVLNDEIHSKLIGGFLEKHPNIIRLNKKKINSDNFIDLVGSIYKYDILEKKADKSIINYLSELF